jgi:hypothetical protein
MPANRLTVPGDIPDTGIPPAKAARMTIAEQYDWHQAYLRRHRVSRRNFLRGSAAVAAAATLGFSPFGRRAYAQDAPLAVANRRVGYGADACSQLRFAAQLSRNLGSTKIFVDHGPTPALGATLEAEVRNLVTQIPVSGGGVLGAEQFYVHAPVDGLPGRTPQFYRWRTEDGFASDVRSAATAMPNARDAMGPFRFTMMGDHGTDETPLSPPGIARGDYDNRHYKPDNDPAVPHTENVAFLSGINIVPFTLSAWTIRLLARLPQHAVAALATNVPGPRGRQHVMGREVLEVLPVPPIALQLRTGIAMVSYGDTFVFGITGDHDTAPDVDQLAAGVEKTVARLVAVSRTRQRKQRRVKEIRSA